MSCSRCKFQNKSKLELPCLECTQNRAIDYFKPMTNADRIRNMTDEELAEFFSSTCYIRVGIEVCYNASNCKKCFFEWLQAEVESCE